MHSDVCASAKVKALARCSVCVYVCVHVCVSVRARARASQGIKLVPAGG